MSYSKRLEDYILKLKGGVFFLSPREKLFLKFLEEMGVPEKVVREGIERCYRAINPLRRSRRPLFLCYKDIMDEYENHLRLEAYRSEIDWKGRFKRKIELVKDFLKELPKEPKSEEEAQRVLKEIEKSIARELWRKMSREEKKRIEEKFKEFKENREVYGELIKREVQRIYKIPTLSLYVD